MQKFLYGAKDKPIESVALEVERLAKLKLERRSSEFFGGRYFVNKKNEDGLYIHLQHNVADVPDELAEDDFPQYAVLLYVSGEPDDGPLNEALRAHPESYELLRVKHYPQIV